jgi:hypothetical protein
MNKSFAMIALLLWLAANGGSPSRRATAEPSGVLTGTRNLSAQYQAWSLNSSELFAAVGKEISIWDSSNGKLESTLHNNHEVSTIRLVPFSFNLMAVSMPSLLDCSNASGHGYLNSVFTHVWDWQKNTSIIDLKNQALVALSPSGDRFISMSFPTDSAPCEPVKVDFVVWSLKSLRPMYTLGRFSPSSSTVGFSEHGQKIYCHYCEEVDKVFDAETGRMLRKMPRGYAVHAISGKSDDLIVASNSSEITIGKNNTLRHIPYEDTSQEFWTVDGHYLVQLENKASSTDGTVYPIVRYDLRSNTKLVIGECSCWLPSFQGDVIGQTLLMTWLNEDGGTRTGRFYNLVTGASSTPVMNIGQTIGFTPDGKELASFADRVTFYDPENGLKLRRILLE